jgi:hypothetical protein
MHITKRRAAQLSASGITAERVSMRVADGFARDDGDAEASGPGSPAPIRRRKRSSKS